MPKNKSPIDKVRIQILNALLQEGTITINLEKIHKSTKLHKATIKSSIHYLKQEGILRGFYPDFNMEKLGFSVDVTEIFFADKTKKEQYDKIINEYQNDKNVYSHSSVIGSSNYNTMIKQIYPTIEKYHKESEKKYYTSIPGIYSVLKKRQIIFTPTLNYKEMDRSKTIINLLKYKNSID